LAVLAIVGSNLPTSLRAFLLTLAVVDDLIVILIIAVLFTSQLDLQALLLAGACLAAYALGQQRRWAFAPFFLLASVGTWWFVHESGIHATSAGVALGLATRVRPDADEEGSPAEQLEHRLSPLSAGVAVPFFALMSAGVVVEGGLDLVRDPIFVGVVLGLVLGKPVGVLVGSLLVTRFTRAELNDDLSWRDVIGVAVLAGIGFTVSLLVSDLSFDGGQRDVAKGAVLGGSLLAAGAGALILGHRDRYHATP
jgi:NhaA family Na+:H+ antiporter